jgi:hypothetical protein
MTERDWGEFHRRWSRLTPPLRANHEVVTAISNAIENHRERVLLLGVTPELSGLGVQTIALDWSAGMIAHVWPGDDGARRSVLGDWRAMPFRERNMTAVIGDGSLNVISVADYRAVFAQLEIALLPQAKLALRFYLRPEQCETVADVRRAALAGRIAGVHAFKWRVAMAIAAERGSADVAVAEIHRIFEREFPDRRALAAATGWSALDIDDIDAYAGLDTIYSFPTRTELRAVLPEKFRNPRFVASGTYELGERCPILVADFAP